MDEVLKNIEKGDCFSALKRIIKSLKEAEIIDIAILCCYDSNKPEILLRVGLEGSLEIPTDLVEHAINKREPVYKTFYAENTTSVYIYPVIINNLSAFLYIERRKDRRRFSDGEMNILRLLGELSFRYIREKEKGKILNDFMSKRWIGSSSFSEKLRSDIEKISKLPRILIEGETDSGKTLLAEIIHRASGREGEFVVVNCPSIPENLFESELFGHRKGAFTGASYERKGLIGEADGGTLFLDEVSEIPLFLQGKLLRFLDTSLYRRVGEDKERVSKCGVIFATNRNLKKEVEEGRMRKDLYFRINVHTLFIPPLRERKEDIEDIAKYYCMKNGFSIDESAIKELKEYNFPGNVRELENILENLGRKGREINGRMVKEFLSSKISEPVMRREGRGMTLREILSEFEREAILKALVENGWNISKAARTLKISKQVLHYKIKKYKLEKS